MKEAFCSVRPPSSLHVCRSIDSLFSKMPLPWRFSLEMAGNFLRIPSLAGKGWFIEPGMCDSEHPGLDDLPLKPRHGADGLEQEPLEAQVAGPGAACLAGQPRSWELGKQAVCCQNGPFPVSAAGLGALPVCGTLQKCLVSLRFGPKPSENKIS